MLRKEGEHLTLYPWKVKYTQHGEEHEQWALPDREWWIDFAEKWGHTEIIEFVEVELTGEQLGRAREIEQLRMDEGYRDDCIDYILERTAPDRADHPLAAWKKNHDEAQISEMVNAELLLGQALLAESNAAIEETVAMILLETVGGGA